MDVQLKQKNELEENKTAVIQGDFKILKTCHSLYNFKGGDKINIIPEDNKATVKCAFWAYGDHVLGDLMFGRNYMKCIILAVPVFSENKKLNGKDDVPGICGVCIDHGEDNYIAFPLIQIEENEVESFKTCSRKEFQNYLSS